LGYTFTDTGVLLRALTHPSFANEAGGCPDNQRLEYLGDSVLNLSISTELFRRFPEWPEGRLSRTRSHLVCEPTLAELARKVGLGDHLRLGRGEATTGGRDKPSVLSDAFEAVLAALYLDGGFRAADQFILSTFDEELSLDPRTGHPTDFKTTLQELVQADSDLRPQYSIIDVDGPAHARIFTANVKVGDKLLGTGTGMNKKAAHQEAARIALEAIDAEPDRE
jgi:ribonuclease-3